VQGNDATSFEFNAHRYFSFYFIGQAHNRTSGMQALYIGLERHAEANRGKGNSRGSDEANENPEDGVQHVDNSFT
jgi:hypothetical protein